MEISASIVAYKTPEEELLKVTACFLNSMLSGRLFIIDNSPAGTLGCLFNDERVHYLHNPSNPGFGASHNIAIDMALKSGSKYHFVINPDIFFDNDVVTHMVNYMELHPEAGMIMPQILYPDGMVQHLPKLLPGPFWILKRKFKFLSGSYSKFIEQYELRNIPEATIYNAPILSGCFSLLRLNTIKDVGSYDDRYFLYFEDFDLSRRVHKKYKTIYFPIVSVYHGYNSGANRSAKLLRIFIQSAISYFNKWGWFFDKEKKEINAETLSQFK